MLSNVEVNGRRVTENELMSDDSGIVGVKLGDLEARAFDVLTDYEVPSRMPLLPGQIPALRVEVVSQQGDE